MAPAEREPEAGTVDTVTGLPVTLPRKLRGFVLEHDTARPAAGVVVTVALETAGGEAQRLGVLASDRAGYVSFDLGALAGAHAVVVHVWVWAVADESYRVDCLRRPGGDEAPLTHVHEALVEPCFVLPVPRAIAAGTGASIALPSVQAPDVADWKLSPYSFSRLQAATIGEDGCAAPYPSAAAARDLRFYRVVRSAPREPGDGKPLVRARVGPGTSAGFTLTGETFGASAVQVDPMAGATRPGPAALEIAQVVELRQRWLPLADSLGEIVYSAALAPCESVNLAVIDWSRADVATRRDDSTATEALFHSQRRDRGIEETVEGALRESQGGWSILGGHAQAATIPIEGATVSSTQALGAGISQSWGERGVEAESQQDLHDRVTQRTALTRSQTGTVVIQATQNEHNALETRTVTNHNHCHALTLQYYEVLRNFRLVTEVERVRPAVLVPFAVLEFTPTTALRFRTILEPMLLVPALAPCFVALERLQTCPIAYTFPATADSNGSGKQSGGGASDPEPETRTISHFDVTLKTTSWNWSTTYGDVWVDVFLTSESEWKTLYHKERVRNKGPELNRVSWPQSVGGQQIAAGDIERVRVGWQEDNANDSWDLEAVRIDYAVSGETSTYTLLDVAGTGVPANSKSKKTAIAYFDDAASPVYSPPLTVRPQTKPQAGSGKPSATGPAPATRMRYSKDEDQCCADRLLAHLNANAGHYSRLVWVLQDPVERRIALEHALAGQRDVLARLDDTPLAVSGTQVAFAYRRDGAADRNGDGAGPIVSSPPLESIVSLPSRGFFAEAQLGHCNACEKRDVTRYWRWDESPCERPPAIGDITPGPRGTAPTVEPAAVPPSVIQVMQPPGAPDPTGLGGALGLLGRADVFRDMSGRAEVATLLGRLADGSIGLAEAQTRARDALVSAAGASADGAGGRGGRVADDPATQLDRLDVIRYGRDQGLIDDEQAHAAAGQTLLASADAGFVPSGLATTWNAYVFVVGTDQQGGSDFNVMREQISKDVTFDAPYVAITFDFAKGQLRKTWVSDAAGAKTKNESFPLGKDFRVVWSDLELLSRFGTVRELHFLTHFGDNQLFFQPHTSTTTAELKGLGTSFRAAFRPDSVVKIHGCQHDAKLTPRIRDFCKSGTGGPVLLADIRKRMASSFPVVLSAHAGVPVWAAPLGAASLYNCSYLPAAEKGRRFCVETDPAVTPSYGNTIRFYEANYDLIFPRDPGEPVFDFTFHMKYKGALVSGASSTPVGCATSLPKP
jgi:hypothetical protein